MKSSRLAFVALICLIIGCRRDPDRVRFILPNGFRGAFAIKPDDPDGVVLVRENGAYSARIPESGVLAIKGYDPFESMLSTASFESGQEIWVSRRIDDKAGKGQVALLGGYTHVEWDEKQKPSVSYWWFIGTEEEWRAATDRDRSRPGRVVPEPR
jgi:hypothetical protein